MSDVQQLTKKLAKKHGGYAELARRLGVSPRAPKHWADGTRTPRPAILAKLRALAASGGTETPANRWDAATSRSGASSERPPASGSDGLRARLAARVASTASTREQQESLVGDLDELLTDALADRSASYRDRAAVASAKNGALRTLAQMRGETQLTAAQIVRSTPFREALELLEQALEPYPQAARAVAEAMSAFAPRGA